MIREIKPFCCEGIRILRGDFPEITGSDYPLNCSWKWGYSFEDREVYFCPICGLNINSNTYDISVEELNQVKECPSNKYICCKNMENRLDPEDEYNLGFQLFYQSWTRRIFFSKSNQERSCNPKSTLYKEWDLHYCIFCGSKLPQSLLDRWLEIVDKEFGVVKRQPIELMLPFVPEKYRTQEWWIERNL